MAFGVNRTVKDVRKEILKFPAGFDAIESIVLSGEAAEELPSAVTGVEGQLGLLAGTILTKVDGDDQDRYKKFEAEEADKPADMLFHGCVFDLNKIVDYDDYDTDLATALPTCRFIE
jgi:hypothetical protein